MKIITIIKKINSLDSIDSQRHDEHFTIEKDVLTAVLSIEKLIQKKIF